MRHIALRRGGDGTLAIPLMTHRPTLHVAASGLVRGG